MRCNGVEDCRNGKDEEGCPDCSERWGCGKKVDMFFYLILFSDTGPGTAVNGTRYLVLFSAETLLVTTLTMIKKCRDSRKRFVLFVGEALRKNQAA